MHDTRLSFGSWLKARRTDLNLTQAMLARRSGCATVTLKKIEAGLRRPSRQLAVCLAQHLSIPTEVHTAFADFAVGKSRVFLLVAPPVPLYDVSVGAAPMISPVSPGGALPIPETALLGRADDVAAICSLLRPGGTRLVTLTGTGGTGKTRVAIAVARRLDAAFADRVCWVDLTALDEPDLVLPTIARQLGVRVTPTEASSLSLLERLLENLATRESLLVLDNFEHLLCAAPLLTTLLRSAPKLALLVTSRAVLHLSGEQVYHIPPLPVPDHTAGCMGPRLLACPSVALFVERARASRPEIQLTEQTLLAVAVLCRALDGLPLAIELAAARSAVLSPQMLQERLPDCLGLLTHGTHDGHRRHQTLRNTITWSYHLLDTAEQALFRQLAVFVDGCTLEAVEAVTRINIHGSEAGPVAAHRSTIDVLQVLVDHNLVRRTEEHDGTLRFGMFETIHAYAREQLVQVGGERDVRQRHAAYLLTIARSRAQHGPREPRWLARLEREHGNLRAAIRWSLGQIGSEGEPLLALHLVAAAWEFWQQQDHIAEGLSWLSRVLTETANVMAIVHDRNADAARAEALRGLSSLALRVGDRHRATIAARESLEHFRAVEDRRGMAWATNDLACLASDSASAERLHQESLGLFLAEGSSHGAGWVLYCLGVGHNDGATFRMRCGSSSKVSSTSGRCQIQMVLVPS